MGEKMLQYPTSKKKVKELDSLLRGKGFFFPVNLANDRTPFTDKPCIKVIINSQPYYVPVGEETEIPYDVFCILSDCKIINPNETYSSDEFNPFI